MSFFGFCVFLLSAYSCQRFITPHHHSQTCRFIIIPATLEEIGLNAPSACAAGCGLNDVAISSFNRASQRSESTGVTDKPEASSFV